MLWRINPSKQEAFHFTYELPILGSRCNNCRDHIKHKYGVVIMVQPKHYSHEQRWERLTHSAAVAVQGGVDAGVASATPSCRHRGRVIHQYSSTATHHQYTDAEVASMAPSIVVEHRSSQKHHHHSNTIVTQRRSTRGTRRRSVASGQSSWGSRSATGMQPGGDGVEEEGLEGGARAASARRSLRGPVATRLAADDRLGFRGRGDR
jgi:hypothetical protein